ncbi:MAG: Gfo/Idh/MocA family oxidoreductase, partial [Planctomycetia bacterium]|nr:Gfo/Idh/MocA family oxidoreductase [Planctomycetia bacterium]
DPPDGFDYEMWTGPAPMRPFRPVLASRGWRSFMEYGNGTLGDMGVHMFDMVRWLLGLGWPERISSTGGRYVFTRGVQNIPDTQTVIFDYGNLQVVWNHRHWGGLSDPRHPWGGILRGTKGQLKASVFGWDFIPTGKSEPSRSGDVVYELEEYPEDQTEPGVEKHCAPGIRGQMRDLLAHMVDRGPTVCSLEEGAISTISCILGNLSLQLGRTLEWDADAGRVRNDDEANQLLARTYRGPWIHPTA